MDADTKRQKSQELRERLEDADAFVLLGFSGLTVTVADDLRNKFRDTGCNYRVYKNSTIRFAIEGTRHEPATSLLKGVSGLAYNPEDPAAPARVLRDFVKDHEQVQIKGGMMEGEVLDEAGVQRLASLPGPRELKQQLLVLFSTPATNMVRVMHAVPSGLLNVLTAKKDKDAA